jgi:hypothetical protein
MINDDDFDGDIMIRYGLIIDQIFRQCMVNRYECMVTGYGNDYKTPYSRTLIKRLEKKFTNDGFTFTKNPHNIVIGWKRGG